MARRVDPGRRDRIVDSALAVIAAGGVAGTSHRRVAAQADVPLGSMTYHFASMDELLREAFTRFATTVGDRFESRIAAAHGTDELVEAIVDLVHGGGLATSQDDLVLTLELYTLAAREPAFRQITRDWMRRSRTVLAQHVGEERTHALDALVEGLFVHVSLDPEPHGRAVSADAVRRLLS